MAHSGVPDFKTWCETLRYLSALPAKQDPAEKARADDYHDACYCNNDADPSIAGEETTFMADNGTEEGAAVPWAILQFCDAKNDEVEPPVDNAAAKANLETVVKQLLDVMWDEAKERRKKFKQLKKKLEPGQEIMHQLWETRRTFLSH